MKAGGGKQKGSSFEREVCKKLSLWVSGGKRDDCFWRSAMSGGRATVRRKQDIGTRQVGDICSVSPEGHGLTDVFFIECKFYKDLKLGNFVIGLPSPLKKFWETAAREAEDHGKKPMLIAKQNGKPILLITFVGLIPKSIVKCKTDGLGVCLFEEFTHLLYSQLPSE